MPLTGTSIRNAKPADGPIKLFDCGGLFSLLQASGALVAIQISLHLLKLGAYPDVSLKATRDRRDDAREVGAIDRSFGLGAAEATVPLLLPGVEESEPTSGRALLNGACEAVLRWIVSEWLDDR